MPQIKWKTNKADRFLIELVLDRYEAAATSYKLLDVGYERKNLDMDITAVHCNEKQRLDLRRLLISPGDSFMHDIVGISRHVDRTTGKLFGFFSPRCGYGS